MGPPPGVHSDTTCPKRASEAWFGKRVGVPGRARFGTVGRWRPARADAAERGPGRAFDVVHHNPSSLRGQLQSLYHHLEFSYGVAAHTRGFVPQLAHPKRRTLIVIAAVVYYAMRVWTYVYFVPNIFEFGALPPDGPFSAEVVERFRIWVNLSWLRFGFDISTNLLFLLSAFVPVSPDGNLRKLGGEKAAEREVQNA